MMKRHFLWLLPIATLAACIGKGDRWTLVGDVPDGIDTLQLEAPAIDGRWVSVETLTVKRGHFSVVRKRQDGTIYRLKNGGNYIYLPSDSTESLNLKLMDDGGLTLTGSPQADIFTKIARLYREAPDYPRQLLKALDGNYASLAGYYATLCTDDKTVLRAVTNAYSTQRPNDIHTSILLTRLRSMSPAIASDSIQQVVIEAPSIGYFEIALPDRNGVVQKLSSAVDANKSTLLVFNDFKSETSALLQLKLAEALSANPGLSIFEVGFAPTQHQWLDLTEELPWTNVYQAEAASDVHLGQYMISGLPAAFLIKNGEVVKRFTSIEELETHFK